MSIAIITGGRDYNLTSEDFIWLGKMRETHNFRIVLHGGARGVDRQAAAWAQELGLCAAECPAQWKHGKRAGHDRNRLMAWACEDLPVVCLAFPGGNGTASMKRYAKEHNIEVEESPSCSL